MKDVLLISADALFSAMLAGELRSFAGTVAVRPSLTVQQLDDFCETVHPGLLILDLDVEYSQFERILGRTVEQKLPVIVFGYPESEAMTAEKQRFYDSDINRYVFVRPFLMDQFLYCAKELLRGDETERETVRETPAMKMKQHCPADDIHISEDAHIVRYKNDPIVLTRTEYDILLYLMRQRGSVISRAELFENVHMGERRGKKEKNVNDSNVIDVYIRYLRQKLDEPYRVKLIETVRGVGYTIRKE